MAKQKGRHSIASYKSTAKNTAGTEEQHRGKHQERPEECWIQYRARRATLRRATKKTTRVNKALEDHSEAKRAGNAARQTQRRKTQGPHGDQTGARNKETRHGILTMRRLRKHIGRQLGPHGSQKATPGPASEASRTTSAVSKEADRPATQNLTRRYAKTAWAPERPRRDQQQSTTRKKKDEER